MVTVIVGDKKKKEAKVLLSNNDIFDIIHGLNEIYAHAEENVTKFNYEDDKIQRDRYKKCLNEMLKVKSAIL
jgi:hypothetical protein